jgi:hypothetical protein
VVTDAGSVTGVGTGACVITLVEVEVGIAFWSLNCTISRPWILYEIIPLFSQIILINRDYTWKIQLFNRIL